MKLDENFELVGRPYDWHLKLRKDTGKVNEETGKPIIYKDDWYAPKVKMILERYVEEALRIEPDVRRMLIKQNEILETIERLKFDK